MATRTTWTRHDTLALAWQLGRTYLPTETEAMRELVDDHRHTQIRPPASSREDRIAARHRDMLRHAPPTEYRGGPADWNHSRPLPRWLADYRQREHDHDQATLKRGLDMAPVTDWRHIHASVTAEVWWRIWWDLAPTTRKTLADLEPEQATLLPATLTGGAI